MVKRRHEPISHSGIRSRKCTRYSERCQLVIAHLWRRNLKDVGDQALMRGLDTAFPNRVWRYPNLTAGIGCGPATKRLTGIPLPWFHPRRYASGVFPELTRSFRSADLPSDRPHERASSRAIAVQTTAAFLPRAARLRSFCAFQATSRIVGLTCRSRFRTDPRRAPIGQVAPSRA